MTEDQAVRIALDARRLYGVPDSFQFWQARYCIIEIVVAHRPDSAEAPQPGPVLDRVAWLVTFMMDPWTVEFAVDDRTGQILRFRRSRNAAVAGIGNSHGRA
jgi:hypothetical protein